VEEAHLQPLQNACSAKKPPRFQKYRIYFAKMNKRETPETPPHNKDQKDAIESKFSEMKISKEDEYDDFTPVGFNYEEFNAIAEGIHHLEKPEDKREKEAPFLSYDMLLQRIENSLKPSEKEVENKMKIPISIKRDGTKTSLNVEEVCKMIKREPSHLQQFIEVELSVNSSIDAEGRLILKGVFPENQLQKIIKSYIKQYVSCGECLSLNTVLEKEEKLLFKKCHACNASHSVNAIQHGYKAITTKRSVNRRKAENK